METDTPLETIKPRSPKVASLLSELGTGYGQIYCGHLARGLLLYTLCIVGCVFWLLLIMLMKGRFWQAVLIGLVPLAALHIFAKLDARRLASKAPADYTLKDYNHWHVYAMLTAIGITVAICGAFVIRGFAYEAFRLVTDGMSPTIREGQRVVANKTIYDVQPMQAGDVVIVRRSGRIRINVVQRLVALPGDKVEVRGDDVMVNGTPIARPSAAPSTQPAGGPADGTVTRTLPAGHGYFIYDNPEAQRSRGYIGDLGEAPLSNVVGRVEFIYWPRPAWVE